MVDLAGIEPATSSMPWKRAPSCATGPLCEKKSLPEGSAICIFSYRHGLVKLPGRLARIYFIRLRKHRL